MNNSLREDYVRTLTTKLQETVNTGMAVVLMERIEHHLGQAEKVTDSEDRVPYDASNGAATASRQPQRKTKRKKGSPSHAKWPKIHEALRQQGPMTLAQLADYLIRMDPPLWGDNPSLNLAKTRLSATLSGAYKYNFIRPEKMGGKWGAAG